MGSLNDPEETPVVVTINTGDGQYRIEDMNPRYINAWPTPVDGLTTGEDGWFVVLTGLEWGPLDVAIRRLRTAPESIAAGWEIVAERCIKATGSHLEVLRNQYLISVDAPGWHVVRVHARGRASRLAKGHQEGGEEEHMLQIWPTPDRQAPALLVGPDEWGRHWVK